ncbi:DUF2911 domain-containing protein [Rhodocytophaga rosea]|uniref:DUF2911 domain-containing protein n=1 Tax=Rhodocytophaga rosea TaxID=2704465 RepID=A0A6C0GDQ5_9BACT|nr:DUF2911 domain-containing protein [Rhodocytophaga rosea]QHT66139.1 DUF2911 domain-containing protein [Rhodocytophaga rosea]
MKIYTICFLLVLQLASSIVQAQIDFPNLSPPAYLKQKVGFMDITVEYERPAVRERKIMDGLVPFGKIWRTGAGKCTRISFSEDVTIHNTPVKAGSYSLFTVPNATEWTVIFNTDTTLYGAYDYDEKKDVVRFTLVPQKPGRFYETFTIDIDIVNNNAQFYLSWENTQIHFPVFTGTDERIMASIHQQLIEGKSDNGNVYEGAADYYIMNNKGLQQALQFAELAIRNNGEVSSYYRKMQILDKLGKYPEAIEAAKAGIGYIRKFGKKHNYDIPLEIATLENHITELKNKMDGR